MDVASDRVKSVDISRLRLLRDMRERSALGELSKMEAKRKIASSAARHASRELAIAQQDCARVHMELHRELVSFDSLSIAALDRYHLLIERHAAGVIRRRQSLEDARKVREQAETAASEARNQWVRCSAAKHKWQRIEHELKRAIDIHSDAAAEIEADDEVLLRHGRASLVQALGQLL
ncbi:hypothetical protein GGE07_005676 [Sinorhizobium terangae]|uniref:Uncharacterized protein n=1 Tax=Sinorhizobium terangae TaxID=110322 RepID=A0A6N7LES0_SINTE|nr:hypothetical protein [Sinorhizobium terangae]MBB4188997.1 hypothetical protein [Sinorhizobium terangae]MQX16272.1 hypothetical protein [Sinorhizobium terangae]